MIHKKVEGSYTLEATLIMSILIFVIFALIYMAFYLHDKSRIQGVLDKSLGKLGGIIRHEGCFDQGEPYYNRINQRDIFFIYTNNFDEQINMTKQYIQNELSGNLIIGDIKKIELVEDNEHVTASLIVHMTFPFERVKQLFTGAGTELVLSANGIIHNPVEFIRLFNTTAGVITKIKGADKVIEEIRKTVK